MRKWLAALKIFILHRKQVERWKVHSLPSLENQTLLKFPIRASYHFSGLKVNTIMWLSRSWQYKLRINKIKMRKRSLKNYEEFPDDKISLNQDRNLFNYIDHTLIKLMLVSNMAMPILVSIFSKMYTTILLVHII